MLERFRRRMPRRRAPAASSTPASSSAVSSEVVPNNVLVTELSLPELTLPKQEPWNAERERSQNASWLSKSLIGIFGGSLALNLVAAAIFVFFRDESVGIEGYVTLLKEVATFHSTVFAPLLAFILGFYFSEGKRTGRDG